MRDWLHDVQVATARLTRLAAPAEPAAAARAARAYPIVGAAVGAAIGLVHAALLWCLVPGPAAAALAVAFGLWLTQARALAGLAVLVDELSGRADATTRSSPAVGGQAAIVLALLLQVALLNELGAEQALLALAASQALAAATLPALTASAPRHEVEAPPPAEPQIVWVAAMLGIAIALVVLPLGVAAVAMITAAAVGTLLARTASARLGGLDDPALGGAELIIGTLTLVTVVASV